MKLARERIAPRGLTERGVAASEMGAWVLQAAATFNSLVLIRVLVAMAITPCRDPDHARDHRHVVATMPVTRHVFVVVPIVPHEVDRPAASVVLRAVLLVAGRHVQVDRRG
jgi:hypothetical protein